MSRPVVYATSTTTITEFLYTRRGDIFYADDPAVIAHPSYFTTEPPDDMVRRTGPQPEPFGSVEEATANPGEVRRGPGRPRKDA